MACTEPRPFTRRTGGRWRVRTTLQIAATPGHDLGPVVDRAISDFGLEEVFISHRSSQAEKVQDGTRVLAVGLAAFALVAGLAALVAGAQALHRRMAETADDVPALSTLGLSRADCTIAVVLSSLPIIVAGAGLAVVLGIGGSFLMPIGQARKAEPNPGIDVDVLVLGIGALLLVLLLGARPRSELGAPLGSAWPDQLRRSDGHGVPVRQRPVRAVQPARRRHGPRPR